jgi:hypothetical protein
MRSSNTKLLPRREESGIIFPYIDPKVSQWNAERESIVNAIHAEGKAYAPKVKVRNEILPAPHDVYNCTSCRRGRELPHNKISDEDYHYYCAWDLKEHIGEGMKKNFGDNGCGFWDRKIQKPKSE